MTAGMFGADADQLDRLAAEFSSTADTLDSERNTLSGTLNRIEWLGEIATDFTSDWTNIHVRKIGLSTTFLRDSAKELRRQAEEQRTASAASGGVPQGGPGNPGNPGTPVVPTPKDLTQDKADRIAELLKQAKTEVGLVKKLVSLGQNLDKLAEAEENLAAALAANNAKAIAQYSDEVSGLRSKINLSKAGLIASGANAALGVLEQAGVDVPDWLTVGVGGADKGLGIISAVGGAVSAYQKGGAWVSSAAIGTSKVVPVLGIVGGVISTGAAVYDINKNGLNWSNGTSAATGIATVAGSVMLLTPAAPIGAAILAGVAVVEAGKWVYENWDAISSTAQDVGNAVADVASDVGDAVNDAVNDAGKAIDSGFNVVKGWLS